MAKRDVETATIAVAAFNGDVKEEDFVLFCSSPLRKSACVSDDRGDMMMMSDDILNARVYKSTHLLPRLSKSREKKKSM